jgi:flagellar biosynthesis protein FlhG
MTRLSREMPEKNHPPSTEEVEKELKELKEIAQQNHERFLRTSTKLEDLKKRVETESTKLLKYGNEKLMREILPFIDSLERATEHGKSKEESDPRALIEGIQLAIRDVRSLSEKYGLKLEKSGRIPMDAESQGGRVQGGNDYSPLTQNERRTSIMDRHTVQRSMDEDVTEKAKSAMIAVGGAKGGVGKTILAANLAVVLANHGKKVIMVDLDFGGSNLHLYMGQRRLVCSLNDFLCNKEMSLSNIVMPTIVENLSLIGGNNSLLGSANLRFDQKLKLIRALRELEADIILIDLGGDTSFNVLDFYLQADLALVVSSTEPTSYLDAYNFIKLGLLRRLSRYNGPEYVNGYRLPHPVEALLHEAINWQGEKPFSTVVKLLEEIEQIDHQSREKLGQVLQDYRPYLVFNMVRQETQSQLIYNRIRETGEKMLGISINQLGPIPEDERVRTSVRTLKPLLVLDRDSSAAKAIAKTGRYLLQLLAQEYKAAPTLSPGTHPRLNTPA